MTKYSLRARMMILILAPTLLIGLLLSTFFVVHRYNELQEQLVDAGASIIEPLAVASEYGMTFRSRESVRQLVSLLHRRHSDIVRSITVFDAQNNLFVTSNYHHNFAQLQLPKGVPLPTELMLTRRGDSLILRTPILSENQYPDETADGGSHPDNNLGYVAIELDLQSVRLHSRAGREAGNADPGPPSPIAGFVRAHQFERGVGSVPTHPAPEPTARSRFRLE